MKRLILLTSALCLPAVFGLCGRAAAAPPFVRTAIVPGVGPPAWLEQKVTADDGAAGDLFATSLAFSASTAFIGAPYAGVDGNVAQGAACVFTRSGGIWSQAVKLIASDGVAQDDFGYAVALDGTTALIGAPNADAVQGEVYVFTLTDGAWTETQVLAAGDGAAGDFFGQRIVLSGDTAVISAGYADVAGRTDQGAVYMFTAAEGTWSQVQKLTAADGGTGDQFGNASALDGATLVIGAPYHAVEGRLKQGAAYVFTGSDGQWNPAQELTAGDGAATNFFGWSVAVSGARILVGADHAAIDGHANQGAAYAFTTSGGTWTEAQKLSASDGAAGDNFGWSVALDGPFALIGANFADVNGQSQQGAAYAFTDSDDAWMQTLKFTASDGAAGDKFGQAVAISGASILVGANWATVDGNGTQGAAYFYAPEDPVATITPDALNFALVSGDTGSATLTLANAGGGDLTYAFAEAAEGADCSTPDDVAWLAEAPASGSLAGGDSQDVTVGADATALDPGDYAALLCVTTNDPGNALIQVPVNLSVAPNDTVFEDGFDGS